MRSFAARIGASAGAGVSCLLFIGLGLMVIPYPGIQNDEALFASPLYAPRYWEARIRIFHTDVPIMLMNYLGTLKTWLYIPLLRLWAPSSMSIRLPALLAGAATVWLFFLLLTRISGRRAALTGTILLATDVSFLLTTCFDWGPVALQHLLLVSSVLLLVKFHQDGDGLALAGGFFFMGLGLWDKALFAWPLIGLGVAAVVVLPKEIRKHLSARRAATAVLCFVLGASPLLVYNFESRGATFGAYGTASWKDLKGKVAVLERTLEGDVLLGYIAREGPMEHPRPPHTELEDISIWLHGKTGDHRSSLNALAFLAALALIPFFWRKTGGRPLRFALIFLIAAWIPMALTKGAGGSAHHTILLWPFPVLVVSLALAEATRRLPRERGGVILSGILAVLVAENLLVYNQHLERFIRDGGNGSWTDAIFPLSKRLMQLGPKQIYTLDWGMLDSLRLLDQGRLLLHAAAYPLNAPELPEEGRRMLRSDIGDPDHLFLSHTPPFEEFKGVGSHLAKWTCEEGYRRIPIATVDDDNGRPIFEIFHFEKFKDQDQKSCDQFHD